MIVISNWSLSKLNNLRESVTTVRTRKKLDNYTIPNLISPLGFLIFLTKKILSIYLSIYLSIKVFIMFIYLQKSNFCFRAGMSKPREISVGTRVPGQNHLCAIKNPFFVVYYEFTAVCFLN